LASGKLGMALEESLDFLFGVLVGASAYVVV